VVGVLARKAAAALLSTLSAPEAAGAGFAVARTIGLLVGQLVAEVILAALTYGASTTIVAAKAAIQGARVTARFGSAIRRVRTALDPLLDVVKQLKKALDGAVTAIRKWIDDVLEWMRNLARRFTRRFTRKRRKQDEDTRREKVKADALEAASSAVRGKSQISEVRPVLKRIENQYRPKGLRSLTANASSDWKVIELTARASSPERREIPISDVLPKDDLDRLKPLFQKKPIPGPTGKLRSDYTVAALSLNGELVGSEELNVKFGPHAEVVVLSKYWSTALDLAKCEASTGGSPRLVLAINRTPCPWCAKALAKAVVLAKMDPLIARHVEFILAPTSLYEARMARGKLTTGKALMGLAILGWDIRQLATRAPEERTRSSEYWEKDLAEWAAKVHARVADLGLDLRQLARRSFVERAVNAKSGERALAAWAAELDALFDRDNKAS
jgi:hypothetical protein